jgi:tetratricopeptide (TPR) repeat protein
LLHTIATQKSITEDSAVVNFRYIIGEQPSLPLAHHYLGKLLVGQTKYRDAIPILKEAVARYSADSSLNILLSSAADNQEFSKCLTQIEPFFNYDLREDYYLLAHALTQENQIMDAISVYEKVASVENMQLLDQAVFKDYEKNFNLEMQRHKESVEEGFVPMEQMLLLYEMPVKPGSVIRQMQLYEQLQQYDKAEEVLLKQIALSRKAGDLRRDSFGRVPGTDGLTRVTVNYFWINANRDLEIAIHDFYTRMMKVQPRNFYWKQQAAFSLYHRLEMAYRQMPQELYVSFTNDISKQAFPWTTGQEASEPQVAIWALPALHDTIVIETPVFHPVETALNFLQQAQTLSSEAAIDFHTAIMYADMHSWSGNDTASKKWYEYALCLRPEDSTTRNKLMILLLYSGYYPDAQAHLDTLVQFQQIDSAGLQNLIFFHTVAGNYSKASELINQASTTSSLDSCRKLLQRASILLNQKKHNQIINLLKEKFRYIDFKSVDYYDSIELRKMISISYYMIARSYALLKQDAAAINFLKRSRLSGFHYLHVLKNDAAWERIRKGVNKKLFQHEMGEAVEWASEDQAQLQTINTINYRIPDEGKGNLTLIKAFMAAGIKFLPKF